MATPLFTIPDRLPIKRYRFNFTVTQAFTLPDYSGSLLRGIFGHSLKRLSCMTKAESCEGCALIRTCPYPEIFEAPVRENESFSKVQNVPQGYVIEPPLSDNRYEKGDTFSFTMVLMGKSIDRLALITFAWQKALEKGIREGHAALNGVDVENVSAGEITWMSILFDGKIEAHDPFLYLPTSFPTSYQLQFQTAMRLQRNGRAITPDEITPHLFLSQLLRRLSWVSERHLGDYMVLHYDQLAADIALLKEQHHLTWYDWARYSNRQKRKMHLGGMIGDWEFSHLSESLAKLLYIGQWLHAGKNTTFGLGRYQLSHA